MVPEMLAMEQQQQQAAAMAVVGQMAAGGHRVVGLVVGLLGVVGRGLAGGQAAATPDPGGLLSIAQGCWSWHRCPELAVTAVLTSLHMHWMVVAQLRATALDCLLLVTA